MPGLRILWITDEVPDPTLGGGSIRQYHLLSRVAERAEVDLLLMGRLEDGSLRQALHDVMEVNRPAPVSAGYDWIRSRASLLPGLLPAEVAVSSRVVRVLAARLPSPELYDLVQVEHEWLTRLALRRRGGRWMITLHNLLSARLQQAAALNPKRRARWLLGRDAAHAARLEEYALRNYARVLAVSEEDARRLGPRARVVPNGVDLNHFRVTALPNEPRLIFTGSWNWPPNAEAAVWACCRLLPMVRARLPDATLALVGREPPAQVRELSAIAGVETHFDVPWIAPHLERARVAIVPIWIGSGTRLKALEAMAAGRPLVGTSIGLEGLGLVDGYTARIADSADEMADRIVELCKDDDRAGAIAARARQLVERRFGWDEVAESYWGVVLETAAS